MNTSNPIDISKSSLVGLKAELLKKQEEVKRLRELQQDNVKPDVIPKKKAAKQKLRESTEEKGAEDTIASEKDYDALQKSREVLEAKSRLYDRLKGNTLDEETKSKYLIDFDLKRSLDEETLSNNRDDEEAKNSEDEDFSDSNSDPENDWVDFVDALGRSRRCLRKDLPEMRAKDAKLAETLRPPSPAPDTAPSPSPTPELLSWDMQREMMRKKWEEQETLLLGKKDIHYQDVRFDEARPHGVGYFEFSTDEVERARQQEELLRLRAQTTEQQEAARGLRARREQQLQARLAAARRRRRERLGLPPESPPREEETPTASTEEDQKEGAVEEESIVDLEESVKKIAPVRPWDIGKSGVAPVMSQEEWVEQKRQERPAEFAPPSSLIETINPEENTDQRWKPNPNIFTTKKDKQTPLFNDKSKRKHKKSKLKKEKKTKPQEEQEEDNEECFGPSIKDWQNISQESSLLEDKSLNKISNDYTQESSDNISFNCVNSPGENKVEERLGPSVKNWKPTISDIDLLLSRSRAANANAQEEVNTKDSLSQVQSISTAAEETKGFSFSVDTTGNTSFSCTNTDIRKKGYENQGSTFTKKTNYHKTTINQTSKPESSETVIKPIVNLLEVNSDDEVVTSDKFEQSNTNKWKSNKRKFAEIPPPPSMSYYNDVDKKVKQSLPTKPQLADSISAGLNYLKTQTEEKNKKRVKGLLDII